MEKASSLLVKGETKIAPGGKTQKQTPPTAEDEAAEFAAKQAGYLAKYALCVFVNSTNALRLL